MDLKDPASLWNVPALEAGSETAEGGSRCLPCASPALFAVGLSPLSKAARCYLLAAEARIELPLMPRAAEPVVVDASQGIDATVHDALRECLDQIATNLVVVERLDDTEGAHQLRTGLRRLRCVFSIYAPILKCAESDRLAGEARRLAHEVAGLRDLDVAANKIAAEAKSDAPSLGIIAAAFAQKAEKRRKRLRGRLAQPPVGSFLVDLAQFVERCGWTGTRNDHDRHCLPAATKDVARTAICERWNAACKASQGLRRLDFDQSHELRKQIRKLRYTIEFLHSLFPDSQTRPLLGLLRNLQTLLGDVNDASMIKAMLNREARIQENAELKYAAGNLIGVQGSHVRKNWMAAKSLLREFGRIESPGTWM
jgi:triphosphatase